MTKLIVTWSILISFFSHVTFANPAAQVSAADMDKFLNGAILKMGELKSLDQVKEPHLKTAIQKAGLEKKYKPPVITRQGHVLEIATGKEKATLEFVDLNAHKIKLNGKEHTFKSFQSQDILPIVQAGLLLGEVTPYDWLVPSANALSTGEKVELGLAVTFIVILVAANAAGSHAMSKQESLPPLW